MELKEVVQKLLVYAKPHWKLFGGAFLFFTLGAAVEPAIPALFKKLIDSGFKEGLNYPLWIVPIVIISLFAISSSVWGQLMDKLLRRDMVWDKTVRYRQPSVEQ